MRNHRAFTLIELMVVVTIILILLSFLIPAVDRVMGMAQDMTCRAHLQQMGIGLVTYSLNEEFLPASWVGGRTNLVNGTNAAAVWPGQIRKYAGGFEATDMFNCPTAPKSTWWIPRLGSPNPALYGYENTEYYVPGHESVGNSYGHNNDGTRTHTPTTTLFNQLGLSNFPDTLAQLLPIQNVVQPSQFLCFGDSLQDNIWDAFIDPAVAGESLSRRHNGGCNLLFADGHVEYIPDPQPYEDDTGCICIDPAKGRLWNNDWIYP